MNTLPSSVEVGGSDGYSVRGSYTPHTFGENQEMYIMTSEPYSKEADCYVPSALILQTFDCMDSMDRSGELMAQALRHYNSCRKSIPYEVSSKFDNLEDLFRVFPECKNPQDFLKVFFFSAVWVHEPDESAVPCFSFTFESRIDKRVTIEVGRELIDGHWVEDNVGIEVGFW